MMVMQRLARIVRRGFAWARPAGWSWKTWVVAAGIYCAAYGLALLAAGEADTRWSLVSRAAALAPGLAGAAGALAVGRLEKPMGAATQDGRLQQAWTFFGVGALL
jgi:hypothetical protein